MGCLASGTVRAASLEILPLTVNLAPGQTATTLEVTNHGDAPTTIQARPYSWRQSGDDDVLTPTRDIILSPPIFTIPEGASQTIRLLLRGNFGTGGEGSYRLLIDEVPSANIRNKPLIIALRISLPVFVAAATAGPSVLQWRTERGANGQTKLTAVNPGQTYNLVEAIEVTLADGSHPKVVPLSANNYVLPGAHRHWMVQSSAPLVGARLSVTTQFGRTEPALSP